MNELNSTPRRPRRLAGLRRRLQDAGILHKEVAAAAQVSKHMICHVLAGRAKSRRVVAISEELIRAAATKKGAP